MSMTVMLEMHSKYTEHKNVGTQIDESVYGFMLYTDLFITYLFFCFSVYSMYSITQNKQRNK